MAKIPQVFSCHVQVKGQPCDCREFTLANAFTFTLATLDRKTQEKGETTSMETLEKFALCPWHAEFLRQHRTDIFRMDATIMLLHQRKKQNRRREQMESTLEFVRTKSVRYHRARLPAMAVALLDAGLVKFGNLGR